MLRLLTTAISYALMAFLAALRPILGPAECKYGLSCMPYARKQLREMPIHKALWRISRRVISCAPWAKTHEDLIL